MTKSNPFSLESEVALITGGGTGLGLAIATAFVDAGARVILAGRRSDIIQKAATDLGKNAFAVMYDVTQHSHASEMISKISIDFASPTILVNNAGIHIKKPAVETTEADMQRVMETHVIGAHALTRAVVPKMIERKHGSILFIASMASLFGIPRVVAYSAAKTAQLGLVRTLATEFSPHNVRVNAIAPGWIQTEMSASAMQNDPARFERVLARTPMNRFGDPEDVAMAAVYLCSPAAKFVTGAVLPVDGGVSIGF
jgi:gluconate 5-dehydrogenase